MARRTKSPCEYCDHGYGELLSLTSEDSDDLVMEIYPGNCISAYAYIKGADEETLNKIEEKAMIVKKCSFFKPKYYVQGPEWEVMGDVFGHDYTVSAGEIPVVSVHKKWMSWGDVYELDIADNADEILALATVLAIDAVLDAQESSAATT